MRLHATTSMAALLAIATFAMPYVAHADYYTPSHDYAYRSSYDGPGSPHGQVPSGFDRSHDHDTATTQVIQPFSNGDIVVTESDRHAIHDYIHGSYRADCPTGTTKIGRECAGTKHVTTTYIGQVLPADFVVDPLPGDVVTVLQSVPPGYHYMRTGNDVLLLDNSNVVAGVISY